MGSSEDSIGLVLEFEGEVTWLAIMLRSTGRRLPPRRRLRRVGAPSPSGSPSRSHFSPARPVRVWSSSPSTGPSRQLSRCRGARPAGRPGPGRLRHGRRHRVGGGARRLAGRAMVRVRPPAPRPGHCHHLRGRQGRRCRDDRRVHRVRPSRAPTTGACDEGHRPRRGLHRVRRRPADPPAPDRVRPVRRLAPRPTTCCRPRSPSSTSRGRGSGTRAARRPTAGRSWCAPTSTSPAGRGVASGPATSCPTTAHPRPTPVEERSALFDALQALPEQQRKVVVLRHWLGLSVRETATELGINEGTVKSHSSRGLAALEAVLAPQR